MKKLILASNNAKKLKELKAILSDMDVEILSQREAGCNFEVEDDEAYFSFWVRNESDQTINIYAQEIYVDGVKVSDYMHIGEFEPGKCTHGRFSLEQVTPDTYYTIKAFIEIDDEDNDFIDSGDVFSIDVDFDDGTLSAEME